MAEYKKRSRGHCRRWLSCALAAGLMGQVAVAGGPATHSHSLGGHLFSMAPSKGHQALNAAIEAQRRGDYEVAQRAIAEAKARQADLSPVEASELAALVEANKAALEARKKGAAQLDAIERLQASGQKTTASDMMKRLSAHEQFLTAADRERLVRLQGTKPVAAAKPAEEAKASAAAGESARAMLTTGRNLMLMGKFQEAGELAARAEATGDSFAPNEDSPQKLRADLAKYQRDPQFLLAAAHQLLRANELGQAETLARKAEKAAGPTTFMFSADNPSKVLKQIQLARAGSSGPVAMGIDHSVAPEAPEAAKAPKAGEKAGFFPWSFWARSQEQAKAPQGGKKPDSEVSTHSGKETPALKDSRADATPKTGPAARQETGAKAETGANVETAGNAEKTSRVEGEGARKVAPRELIANGRRALAEGKIDDAMKLALQAKAVPGARYGLFEDSPDRLKADVERARTRRDQAEVARLMTEARAMQKAGDLDGAAKLAYKARQLRGSPTPWDLSDRPEKLIAEIHASQSKTVGNAAVEAKAKQARTRLADARTALKAGDVAGSRKILEQVESLRVAFDRPGEDTPEILRKDLEVVIASRVSGSAGTPKGPVAPAVAKAPMAPVSELPAAVGSRVGLPPVPQPSKAPVPPLGLPPLPPLPPALGAGIAGDAAATLDTGKGKVLLEKARVEIRAGQTANARKLAEEALKGPYGVREEALALIQAITTEENNQKGLESQRAASGQGKTLLEKSRIELRAGQTANARRLAEEAFQGSYGVKEEASTVLRAIDTEENNQKALESRRTFDAVVSAYNRKEYEQARNLLAAVNDKMLDKERQSRLKEIISTPAMLPGAALAQAGKAATPGSAPGSALPGTTGGPLTVQALPGAETRPDSLSQAQAMQKVKFDKMQQQGLDAQRDAAEKFRAGQADLALDILGDYIQELEGSGLEAAKVAQLRRPVESRLQHFKLLKAQKEFLDKDATAKEGKKNPIGQKMLAEENRNKKVAEQMKLFNTAFKEGKYLEAESYAMRAQELDPDNAMAAAAVSMAKSQRALVTVKSSKSEKEKFFLDGLNDTDKFGQALTIDRPLDVNDGMIERRNKRASLSALTSPQRKSAAEREIESRLNTPVNLSFNNQPLKDVLEDIRAMYQINIVPDTSALEAEGISLDRPITLKLEQISLKSALNLMLRNVHLTWVVKDEVLQVTTESQARGKLSTVTYQVTDLVLPVENHTGQAGPNSFNPLLSAGKDQGSKAPGAPTPIGTPLGLNGGQPVGSSTSAGQAMVGDGGKWNKRTGTTTEDALIRIITSTIEPQSWNSVGGAGTIEYHPLTMSLVVNQTPNIQEQVADLLNNLRRLLDQEVALEIKLISIAEDFYERIGLDFNLNIKTDRNTAKFEPMITSGAYKPGGYINDPYFRNMVGGLTPAGSFTSDLDIPINQNSFNLTNPAFGNYFGAPGGGINMGLAFLSDIQVFLFLEAAQGDTRTNVMQAPKLTLFNGQTATLNVGDTQFFVTGVNLQTLANGNVAFEPEVQGYFNGIQLTIQAIISADRRTVRLSPNISMQNLAPGPVNLFPVVVPIFPQPGFNQPNPADPITFTQLIQQPVIQSVTVQTTVAVPDGGTVLMGGLKRLSEARNEYGPPILSKIPYINRLFRNTGYGREATSLLMMITPRIIIQEEEEQLQTNFRPAPQVAP